MLVCIQVAPMQETMTEKLINAIVERGIRGECFHLERLRLKKIRGEMHKVRDRILPGYIFVDTEDFDGLYTELKRVPKLTSVVLARAAWEPDKYGWEGFCQLSAEEEKVIRSLVASGSSNASDDAAVGKAAGKAAAAAAPGLIGLSQVTIEEGKTVTIVSGPLKGNEGLVKKVDLHRREAKVEIELMGRKMDILLGIELIGEKLTKAE